MGKSSLAFAILVLVSVTPAFGQYVMVIEACSKDVSNLAALLSRAEAHSWNVLRRTSKNSPSLARRRL